MCFGKTVLIDIFTDILKLCIRNCFVYLLQIFSVTFFPHLQVRVFVEMTRKRNEAKRKRNESKDS